MHTHRNIRPPAQSEALELAPFCQRHIELLRRIESPLIHIAEIVQHGTDNTGEHIEKFRGQYFESDVRPTALIFTTRAENLHTLEAMDAETLRGHAVDLIQDLSNPANNALLWQILAMHLGKAMELFKNWEIKNN